MVYGAGLAAVGYIPVSCDLAVSSEYDGIYPFHKWCMSVSCCRLCGVVIQFGPVLNIK